MSALPPKADIGTQPRDVRFVKADMELVQSMSALPPIADISCWLSDVRFVPKADIHGAAPWRLLDRLATGRGPKQQIFVAIRRSENVV